ncbi:hypothetical protein [Polaromonas sp. JS666]|uniref:hypothetical protein n=1 Tax=Polaromonas sp. (strain JS666 / ATCC BAA-500) TaxID=296591 RepID=UPI0000464725|nr:hypothetical protein [Polaromonas sp. JS666]ABE47372.1 hypothetical protein Bpro_5519 [Polaromonas sp. JS666]
MPRDFQHAEAPAKPSTSAGAWTRTGPQPTAAAARASVEERIFLVLASGRNLAAAGVDMNRVRAVDFGKIVGAGAAGGAAVDILSNIRLAHIELMGFPTAEAMREEGAWVGAALSALRGLAPEQINKVVEQLKAKAPSADAAADELYQVLTAQEMADRMKLTLPVIYQRETAGELFAVLEPYRKSGRLFPAFQLNQKLNHRLLVRVIKAYRDADVNTTLLWSFLRTPQRIFGGLTPIEMLVGGMPPAYEGLKPDERAAAILDVVAEELSRVRLQ